MYSGGKQRECGLCRVGWGPASGRRGVGVDWAMAGEVPPSWNGPVRLWFAGPWPAPELGQGGPVLSTPVSKEEVPDLVWPHPAPDAIIPAHGSAYGPVVVGKDSPQGSRTELHHGLDELDPHQNEPRWHVPVGQHLVFVVPLPLVGLDHASIGRQVEIRRPPG